LHKRLLHVQFCLLFAALFFLDLFHAL
jgi:hypothetical protein